MQIQISWLLQKPTDLDLHCLQRQGISAFSRTRVKLNHNQIVLQYKYHLSCPLRNEGAFSWTLLTAITYKTFSLFFFFYQNELIHVYLIRVSTVCKLFNHFPLRKSKSHSLTYHYLKSKLESSFSLQCVKYFCVNYETKHRNTWRHF